MTSLIQKLNVGVLATLLLYASAHAAVISVETWDADPSSSGQIDWSAGNAGFSHAVKFNGTSDVTFNSTDGYGLTGTTTMTFYNTTTTTFSGTGGSGSINTSDTHTGGDAKIGDLTQRFFHKSTEPDNTATLTLTGLSTNTEYELVLYQAGTYTGQTVDFSFVNSGAGSSGNASLNDVDRGNTKISVAYTTGDNTSVDLIGNPDSNNDSMHWYAFSNAIVPEPSTFALATLGLLGLIGFGRRRKR